MYMKKLRPTIPVYDWKLAVDLALTRQIQNLPDLPAHGDECNLCSSLKRGVEQSLPLDLIGQLKRVGVNLLHPTDIYITDRTDDNVKVRCVYHAVASILSGPNQWESDDMCPILHYRKVSDWPSVSLVVVPQRDIYEPSLSFQGVPDNKLVRIDFRLELSKKWEAGDCV
jgi:hypothetical protein